MNTTNSTLHPTHANTALKSYRSPHLIVYGDIQQLTNAVGTTSMKGDGGPMVSNKTA